MATIQNQISVSYIIPTFNRAEQLEETIASLENQSGIDLYEIIIVNDGSTDCTEKLIKSKNNPFIKLISSSSNRGAAYSRNLGFIKSNYDYLFFLDSDVVLSHDASIRMVREITNYDLVHAIPIWPNKIPISAIELGREYPMVSACYMIKRERIEHLFNLDQLYDENYIVYFEDLDFFFRCYLLGIKAKLIEENIVDHVKMDLTKDTSYMHYLSLRNCLYSIIKFRGIRKPEKPAFKSIFSWYVVLFKVKGMLMNRDYHKAYYSGCSEIIRDNNGDLLKITDRRSYLLYLILKAFLWNLFHLPKPLKAGEKLKSVLCQY